MSESVGTKEVACYNCGTATNPTTGTFTESKDGTLTFDCPNGCEISDAQLQQMKTGQLGP